MSLDECTHLTAKYKHLLIPAEDEQEFEDELDFVRFNFCPFCGEKIDRAWQSATVGDGGDCDKC